MPKRGLEGFQPIISTAPSFQSTSVANVSTAIALEATSVREWQSPGGRSIRIFSQDAPHYHVALGDSNIVAAASHSIMINGGDQVILKVPKPSYTHFAAISSTDLTVNVTLGYGR